MEDPQDLLKTMTKGDSLAGPVCERARHPTPIEGRAKQKKQHITKTLTRKKNIPTPFDCACQRKENDISLPKNNASSLPFRISHCLSTYHSLWITGHPICAIQSICVFAMTTNVSAI